MNVDQLKTYLNPRSKQKRQEFPCGHDFDRPPYTYLTQEPYELRLKFTNCLRRHPLRVIEAVRAIMNGTPQRVAIRALRVTDREWELFEEDMRKELL